MSRIIILSFKILTNHIIVLYFRYSKGIIMTKIQAVLFDMDGVLIDAKEWHFLALNRALAIYGYEIPLSEHLLYFDGLPTKVKLQKLSDERGLPIELHGVINEKKQLFTMEIVMEKCKPNPIHTNCLAELKSRGYHIACCSNSIRNTIETMMKCADLDKYLEFIISNQDVSKPKPDPEIYTTAMKKVDLKPTECLIIEDNENGVRAALASGGHLLKVNNVNEVNIQNITNKIKEIERN